MLCSACWQRHPGRPFIRGEHLRDQLPQPPPWLGDFVAHVAAPYRVARACGFITDLGRLLEDEHSNSPQALLGRSRRPGRSMGSLARALEDFFTARGLALPTDQTERLAAGRRWRRIETLDFLYSHTDLRKRIETPHGQRAAHRSLRQEPSADDGTMIHSLTEALRRERADYREHVQELEQRLAVAHGEILRFQRRLRERGDAPG